MDVSPIQRVAARANHAVTPVERPVAAPAVTVTAQATTPRADEQRTHHNEHRPATRVVVSWHPASIGYVTRVVDQHTGKVLHQTPPAQVLAMVQQVIARLEKGTT